MANKPDFAQKLLHDLRLRKERMAASQSSGHSHSNSMARDAYGNSGHTNRGSRQIKALESVGSKTASSQRRSSGGSRSLSTGQSSNQIVPYGGQSSKQIGDLSMALFFALENGGKLGKMNSSGNNSMLGFLHQIGRRSLDIGKMERRSSFDKHRPSTSQFPTFSHVHIKDISKGVQNLNHILKACSNGLNFDRYSIEIGKELLKGAIDLEESLRMLVNLQEASEYMITPKRKNQITLLEEEEDDETNSVKVAEQKQLSLLPRFSFDKPSRNSHGIKEAAKNDIKQRLMALTYPTDVLTTSNLAPHKRSASCGPDFKTVSTLAEPKRHSSSSQSKPEKGRISNVIAKLMGLEEVPEKVNSQARQKESSSKQKEGVVSKTAYATTKNAEPKTRETENLPPLAIEKRVLIQANKIPPTRDTAVLLKAEKTRVSPSANSGVVVTDEKPHRNDFERANRTNATSGSKKATITIDRQQINSSQASQIPGNRKDSREKEREQDSAKHKEQRGTAKGETKEIGLNEELQQKVPQKHRSPEVENILQEKNWRKDSTLQTEKRNAVMLIPSNQQKHQAEKREQQVTKQSLQARKNKESLAKSKVSSKPVHGATSLQKKQPQANQETSSKRSSTQLIDAIPSKKLPDSRHYEDLVRDENYTTSVKSSTESLMNGNLDQNASPRELRSKPETEKGSVRPLMQEKPVHVQVKRKNVDSMQVHRIETPRKIDEVMTRRHGTPNKLARPLKHHIPIMQELKQRRYDKISGSKGGEQLSFNRTKEAEGGIKGSNKSEASNQPPNGAQQMHNVTEQLPASNNSGGDDCQSPKVVYTTLNGSSQNITSEVCKVPNDHQGQEPASREDPEPKSHKYSPNPPNGAYEGTMEISYLSKHEHKKVFTSATQELLTENEKNLKEILIKSQLFLNTAEAIFKLNIPLGILHASDHNCQDEDTKLIVDCGYEVMNRKGRKQELAAHPCVKISISYIKVRSLDDLVKQLYKGLESLKFYGGNESEDCDAVDYLHKMLERDIQYGDLDLNSMWDFGWNEMIFAFVEKDDVIRDVERQVLNGLIDEITKDLLHVTVSV